MNLFIHRRDLRITDNTTLNQMCLSTGNVSPLFIFTPEQITHNPYFSSNLVQFMCEALVDLKQQYRNIGSDLSFYYGDVISVLESIHKVSPIQNLGFNLDYSPYAKLRDTRIKEWCQQNNIKCWASEDMLLVDIISQKNYPRDKPYVTFTHFMNYQREHFKVEKPSKRKISSVSLDTKTAFSIPESRLKSFYQYNQQLLCIGSQDEALQALENLQSQGEYDSKRGHLPYQTSQLSPYINLGLLSIRQVYRRVGKLFGVGHGLITELYWRDFYYNVLHHFPRVVGHNFNDRYDQIPWENNKEWFQSWCQAKTGFPVVDACMTQLNTTGYMHNRGRMIVANFLTKILLIDWRWGEKYFAQNLLDYNISANNGGWQWSAHTGTDVGRFNRIFNPWSQITSWDKSCSYVKKWLPQLKALTPSHIAKWDKYHNKYPDINYPAPMVNYSERRKHALAVYAEAKT